MTDDAVLEYSAVILAVTAAWIFVAHVWPVLVATVAPLQQVVALVLR